MANRIQLRRDTTANWESVDPILADGEPGYDIVTNEIRIGDGSLQWSQLSANTISGGGASTGDVTFSDINVIGTSSLRLQPNVALDESYIDIYLTSGPDIHIDNNSGNLILGKDSWANVRLATDGNVQIRAEDGGSTSTWTFDPDGTLTLPGHIKNGTAGLSFPSGGVYLTTNLDDDNNALYFDPISHDAQLYVGGNITLSTAVVPGDSELDWTFGTDGSLTLPNATTFEGVDFVAKENDELNLTIPDSSAYIGVKQSSNLNQPAAYMDVYYGKKSRIRTASLDNQTEYDWIFSPDGDLTIPGNIKSETIPQVGLQLSTGEPNFGYGGIRACFSGNTFTGGSFSNIQVGWTVGGPNGFTDIVAALNDVGGGFITLTNQNWPGQGPYTFSSPNYAPASANNLQIETGSASWNFNTGGVLSNDDDGYLSLRGSSVGPTSRIHLRNSDNDPTSDINVHLQTAGAGNIFELFQLSSGHLTTPYASGLRTNSTTAPILIQTNTDGSIKTWKFGADGNLTIPGEIKSIAGTGPVSIQSNDGNNTYTWNFGTDGSLTFPDTTIQTTAYKRTTGSWTVATGSATYSFTVPSNGTYAMWVKGSITNGIIAWNATATVTNSNVPVIGQQFAWNYTGGGTPIAFTAIPTQFVGTANTIVSSDPSVGTTSNKFDFVINNTSGSAQTVYWGYVAQ